MRKQLLIVLILLLSGHINSQIGGYALKFDGTDDYVDITSSGTSVLGDNSDNNSFTIETWFKYSDWGWEIFTKHSENGVNKHGYFLERTEDWKIKAGYGSGNAWVEVVGTQIIDNKWHHYAMVYNNTGTISLYIDGVLQGTSGTFTPQHSEATINLRLMTSHFYGSYTSGYLDEFRVWNTIRTEAEIKANMYKELAGNETGLVAYYKMSNGSGTDLDDNKSGGTNPGSLNGGTLWTASGCFAGSRQALDFDGSNDYVAFTEANSPVYNNNALTIEAWIKSTSTLTEEEIVNWGNNAGQNVVEFRMSTGNIEFGMDVSGWYQVSSNSMVNDGKWNHVAVTKDGNNIKFYINGKLDASGTISVSPSVNRMTIANVFQNNSYHSGRYEFLGQIDEVRIWNSVRTEEQLRENMMINLVGNEAGLIAYYRFDHYDGTTLYDCTNNGKNGTLTNMDAATDWVASLAFTTWIGSENNSWYTGGNWSRNIAPMYDNTGLYKWDGGYDLNITSPGLEGPSGITANNILFSVTSNPVLYTNISVSGNLLLGKNLNLNGQTVNLGATGYLVEGNYRLYGTSGTITTSRPLSGLTSLTNIAGLGLSLKINSGSLSGNTIITRGHSEHLSGGLFYNTRRYYDVTASGTFNVDILYKYHQDELNGGSENDLRLYKSTDGGTSWIKQESAVFNAIDNTFSLTDVTSMSRWTTADNSSPLPVELSSLTAKASGSSVIISWKTSTEVNNYGFEVERSLKTEDPEWNKIGFIPGAGNSNSPKEYSFTDDLNDASLQSQNHKIRYRLKQIDNDGTFSYSKEVEIENLLPSAFELSQNYPNPFNPSTTIRFGLPADTRVTLEVFNIIGEKVATLLNNEIKSAGYYDVLFKASELSSGVYFYRLTAGEFISTKKLNIIK